MFLPAKSEKNESGSPLFQCPKCGEKSESLRLEIAKRHFGDIDLATGAFDEDNFGGEETEEEIASCPKCNYVLSDKEYQECL